PAPRAVDAQAGQQPCAEPQQAPVIARQPVASRHGQYQQRCADRQHCLDVAVQAMEERVQQDAQQRAEEKYQVTQLIHGEYRAAARRGYA
nr:hypothetical protein [Tanacetum cinerariifolium]